MKNDVHPFPFRALEGVSRLEADARPRLRRFFDDRVRIASLLDAAGHLLGATLEARVRAIASIVEEDRAPGDPSDDVALVLSDGIGASDAAVPFLVSFEATFAARAVARVFKQPEPRIVDPALVGGVAEIHGAFAALVWTVARRVHTERPLQVITSGSRREVARAFLAAHPRTTSVVFTLVFDDDAYLVTVFAPELASPAASRPLDLSRLRSLGALPLSLAVVRAIVSLPQGEVARLAPGDALLLGVAESGTDEVVLAAPRAEHGLRARLEAGTRVVIGQGLVPMFRKEEDTSMVDAKTNLTGQTTAVALEDSPVLVRVELGSVEMAASDWAELSAGDVITIGRGPNEPVVLRAGGVEIARGELVMVQGEVGVRILERRA